MSVTTVLFDLDGTLLPMDQDVFAKTYFTSIAKAIAPLGYAPEAVIKGIWAGTKAMVQNTGEKTNETVFWETFAAIFGDRVYNDQPAFDRFYVEHFDEIAAVCGHDDRAAEVIRLCHERGRKTILATNPIFPRIATKKRMKWAGLKPEDFECFTTYENSCYCKPNLKYYTTILETLDVSPEECLMVGNDVSEDMVARELGIQVFLLTDCMINKKEQDISMYPHGDFDDLLAFLDQKLV